MARAEHAPKASPSAFIGASERSALGKAARAEAPRSSHSQLPLADDRDALALLESQARSRVRELVPIRYGRMVVSPLAYFRGAATVMAHDLGPTPTAGLGVQLSGDAHFLNFGGFASPERDLASWSSVSWVRPFVWPGDEPVEGHGHVQNGCGHGVWFHDLSV
jgi:hypothetical protein